MTGSIVDKESKLEKSEITFLQSQLGIEPGRHVIYKNPSLTSALIQISMRFNNYAGFNNYF